MSQYNIYGSDKLFNDFKLPKELVQSLYEAHFDLASEIQKISIPIITSKPYKSLLAQSQNGTGKTLSFIIGMLARIEIQNPNLQAICLFSTRELVIQTYEYYIKKLTNNYKVKTTVLVRDPPIKSDISKAQLIISTPMQFDQADINLSTVKVLVIDEADSVLGNQSFTNFFKGLFPQLIKNNSQILLFSTTFSQQVRDFVNQHIPRNKLGTIEIDKKGQFSPTNKHFYFEVESEEEKVEITKKMYKYISASHSFIFVNQSEVAKEIGNRLSELGFESQFLSSKLRRNQRDQIVSQFKKGLINVLLCTDTASLGLDVPSTRVVINFDLPFGGGKEVDFVLYMSRQGRAGRYGRSGVVIDLISSEVEKKFIENVQEEYGVEFQRLDKDSDESIREAFIELNSFRNKPIHFQSNENDYDQLNL